MSLRFEVEWQDANFQIGPEHRSTWCSFAMYVGEECLTTYVDAKTKVARQDVRVPIYDLAEWIAFNWFALTTPYTFRDQSRDSPSHNLRNAGGGFPYPSVEFHPEERDLILNVQSRGGPLARGSLIVSGRYEVDRLDAQEQLAHLVRLVIQRLESRGISDTRLQEEWARIQLLTAPESQFCRASASLGLDPFDLSDDQAGKILSLNDSGLSIDFLTSFLPAVNLDAAMDAVQWVQESLPALHDAAPLPTSMLDNVALLRADQTHDRNPWSIGWERANRVRAVLGVDSEDFLALDDIVRTAPPAQQAPGRIEGLIQANPLATILVPRTGLRPAGRRFLAARTLSRAIFQSRDEAQVLWHGADREFRVERAFAAELLAPAAGVAEVLQGDFSTPNRKVAASHFKVDVRVIDHQIENQLVAA